LPTFGGDLFGRPFQAFHVAGDDDDLRTAFRGELGRGEADAGRSPGNDDRLLLQGLELHEISPFAQVSLCQWLPIRIVPRGSVGLLPTSTDAGKRAIEAARRGYCARRLSNRCR